MSELTHGRLLQVITYDPDTGRFTWLVTSGSHSPKGTEAGGVLKRTGYRVITIDGKTYRAGRLAWFYMTGLWPKDQIDHADRNRSNDAFHNLRECTQSQNQVNRDLPRKITPCRGIFRSYNKWQARIWINGTRILLGSFPTAEAASNAYESARAAHHGEFVSQKPSAALGAG